MTQVEVTRPRPASQRLQVYAKEGAFLDQVGRFLAGGLALGEAVLVVAAGSHLAGLRSRLAADAARCTFLDADAVLGQAVNDGRLDPVVFERLVGDAARAAVANGKGRARAYGELVARLLAQGLPDLAQEAEAGWNRVLAGMPLTLLCAYPPTAIPAPPAAPAPVDLVPRQQDQVRLRQLERQQAAVARIGHLALSVSTLDGLFTRVCQELVQVLGTDSCGLLQCVPGSSDLQFRAGHGFPSGFMPRVPGEPGSHSAFVLAHSRPVVYGDLPNETRFTPSALLLGQGVRSGMSTVVPTAAGNWGTLGVHTRQPHAFSPDDADVLASVAHILGAAIDRRQSEQDLMAHREHLESLVRERTSRLEQANRELDAFNSAVSHDLRGPVRAISGFAALLAQRHSGRLDPHGRELLEEIRRATGRMGDLVEDLLDLSRADRAAPEAQQVDLTAMAHDILATERRRTPERSVACQVEDGLLVEGDAGLLRMALENLLSNAWKFTAHRTDARIEVSKHREGDDVVLCVQDNGAGFDMADAGRLFQPFQRLHRRSDFDGTGIGLATVRRIIERHGGRIWAHARPGLGAAFYFTLPSRGNRPSPTTHS